MFNFNFSANKVAYHFSEEAKDEEIKAKLHEIALMHSNICTNLINILGVQNEQ